MGEKVRKADDVSETAEWGELFWVEFFKQAEIKAGIFAMD